MIELLINGIFSGAGTAIGAFLAQRAFLKHLEKLGIKIKRKGKKRE